MANGGSIAWDRGVFKLALMHVVNNPEFGTQLEEKPGTALQSLGFELAPKIIAELDSRKLSETIVASLGGTREPTPLNVAVHVGVSVGVQVFVHGGPVITRPSPPGPPGPPGPPPGPPPPTPQIGIPQVSIDTAVQQAMDILEATQEIGTTITLKNSRFGTK